MKQTAQAKTGAAKAGALTKAAPRAQAAAVAKQPGKAGAKAAAAPPAARSQAASPAKPAAPTPKTPDSKAPTIKTPAPTAPEAKAPAAKAPTSKAAAGKAPAGKSAAAKAPAADAPAAKAAPAEAKAAAPPPVRAPDPAPRPAPPMQNRSTPPRPAAAAAASARPPVYPPRPAPRQPVVEEGDDASSPPPPPKPKGPPVEFKAGDHVVYPTHGVGQVQGIEEMPVAGMSLKVIIVTFEENRMTLRVPVNKAASSGLRKLASAEMMNEALEVLRGRARIKRTMWSRRAQEYEAKINSGDPLAIAEVVRDLHRNAGQPDQSFSERQIYEQALDRLSAELAAIDRTDKNAAADKLQTFLKTVT
ncbi:CarD family transcriptional regulator [Falsiroseomonas stagni]|uniref:Transcriptional regulator, CarD family n=1 Tax=Falsiroseomonas stagni DSM 19981 TaxID=1123062 RepID=A0A1I3Y4G1_9PROT|nr:CarD family transcriptional regulator [Falsiroseomonas stagni]SFK26837.1 transcriptional regulator, CarD family [Falsiroseomonas stagni DSM 19981]